MNWCNNFRYRVRLCDKQRLAALSLHENISSLHMPKLHNKSHLAAPKSLHVDDDNNNDDSDSDTNYSDDEAGHSAPETAGANLGGASGGDDDEHAVASTKYVR